MIASEKVAEVAPKIALDRDMTHVFQVFRATGLVDCYNYLDKPTEAKQAAERALELDESLGEAHASLAFSRFLYDWDWAGAEKGFKRAIELSSSSKP